MNKLHNLSDMGTFCGNEEAIRTVRRFGYSVCAENLKWIVLVELLNPLSEMPSSTGYLAERQNSDAETVRASVSIKCKTIVLFIEGQQVFVSRWQTLPKPLKLARESRTWQVMPNTSQKCLITALAVEPRVTVGYQVVNGFKRHGARLVWRTIQIANKSVVWRASL